MSDTLVDFCKMQQTNRKKRQVLAVPAAGSAGGIAGAMEMALGCCFNGNQSVTTNWFLELVSNAIDKMGTNGKLNVELKDLFPPEMNVKKVKQEIHFCNNQIILSPQI